MNEAANRSVAQTKHTSDNAGQGTEWTKVEAEENKEIPEECPLIETCKELVDKEQGEFICNTDAWRYCEVAPTELKDLADKYKKKPREWRDQDVE